MSYPTPKDNWASLAESAYSPDIGILQRLNSNSFPTNLKGITLYSS